MEITGEDMRRGLVKICTGNDILFPRKEKDRHVMLAAASRRFERGMIYTEKEVDKLIRSWLDDGCPSLLIDEVTLRRELIDANYLMRDQAGRFYALGSGPGSVNFTPEASEVDVIGVVVEALSEREARRRAYTKGDQQND